MFNGSDTEKWLQFTGCFWKEDWGGGEGEGGV